MDDQKRPLSTTTDGKPPAPGFENAATPTPINPDTGQAKAYWILTPEERAKGFVRPVRRSYRHVGRAVCGHIMPPADERLGGELEICTMEPDHEGDHFTRSMRVSNPVAQKANQEKRLGGCDEVTTMSRDIAETYAAKPNYYGNTFCVGCNEHLPVGENGEFVWLDFPEERVGGLWPLPERVQVVGGGMPSEGPAGSSGCRQGPAGCPVGEPGDAGEDGEPASPDKQTAPLTVLPMRPQQFRVNGFLRRQRIDLCTPAETAIRQAVMLVEMSGADPKLTDAVIKLGEARELVADYVDSLLLKGGDV